MNGLKMQVEDIAVDALVFDPANVRKHGEENLAAIKASLTRFGQQKPIVVDGKGIVVAGNGTLAAAKALGWKSIKAVRTNLIGAEATAFAIADNRTAELAEWDEAALHQQLAAIAIDDEELLAATGFDEKELAKLAASNAPEVTEDETPEPPAEPITQPGDLWLLGKHRLLCGDSTKTEDVKRLMDGKRADICFTSPPYALGKSVSLRGTAMSGKQRVYDNHDDNPDEWAQLMNGWWDASMQAVENAWLVNIQPLAGNKRDLMRWINTRVDRLIDIITWDKGPAACPQMAAGVLASRYEWIIGMGKPDASRAFPLSSWRGTLQSVYEAPMQRNNDYADIHAATMPVHVPAWIMGKLCDRAQSVYEPFCGTGTTLIAAEQLGRTCYGMEISQVYCDVIIKRWETLTGQKAEREVK